MGQKICITQNTLTQDQEREPIEQSHYFVRKMSSKLCISKSFSMDQGEYHEQSLQQTFQQHQTLSTEQDSILSYCKIMGIGKYMDIPSGQEINKIWDHLIKMTGIRLLDKMDLNVKPPNTTQKEENEYIQQVKQKYKFVDTNKDVILLSLFVMDQKGIQQLIRLGPPSRLRWSSWKIIALLGNKKLCSRSLYVKMLSQTCNCERDIQKDVTRTFTSHHFFVKNNVNQIYGQEMLNRVLKAISNTYPQLGYCQGMNFIVGFLLMISGCDEFNTYACFDALLSSPKYLIYFIYCEDLPLLQLIQFMVKKHLEKHLPAIYHHIYHEIQCVEQLWITKILLSVYLFSYKLNDCIRIWDYFLTRGSIKSFLEITVALLDSISDSLMKFTLEDMCEYFQNGSEQFKVLDINAALKKASENFKVKKIDIIEYVKQYQKLENLPTTSVDIVNLLLNMKNKQEFEGSVNNFFESFNQNK